MNEERLVEEFFGESNLKYSEFEGNDEDFFWNGRTWLHYKDNWDEKDCENQESSHGFVGKNVRKLLKQNPDRKAVADRGKAHCKHWDY
jgi:hypothetical protein